jgi:hypothetical protein
MVNDIMLSVIFVIVVTLSVIMLNFIAWSAKIMNVIMFG